jgi:hypothetical protein
MRLRRLIPTSIALATLAFPAGALANDFQQIFGDYKADGQLDGCYRPDQIHNAGQSIPPDIEQYAPGFGDALSSAQAQCASGQQQPSAQSDEDAAPVVSAGGTPGAGVKKKKAVTEPPAPEPTPTAVSTDLAAPELVPATAAVSSDTPGALIALLVAAGIAVALALAWTIAWFMGWSPERLTKPVFAAFQSMWDRVSIRSSP